MARNTLTFLSLLVLAASTSSQPYMNFNSFYGYLTPETYTSGYVPSTAYAPPATPAPQIIPPAPTPAPQTVSPPAASAPSANCTDIRDFGSPVNLIGQARTFLEAALSLKSTATVNYLHFDISQSFWMSPQTFTLVFELVENGQSTYAGLKFNPPSQTSDQISVLKFLIHPKIEVVRKILGVSSWSSGAKGYDCGNIKAAYDPNGSASGAAATSGLNNGGANLQGTGYQPFVGASGNANIDYTQVCAPSHFVNENNYFISTEAQTVRLGVADQLKNSDGYFEVYRCHPQRRRVIDTLIMTCILNDSAGNILNAKVLFTDPFSDFIQESRLFGPSERYSKDIFPYRIYFNDVTSRVSLYYGDSSSWWAIKTFDDKNNALQTMLCGRGMDFHRLDDPSVCPARQTIEVRDLAGIFGGKLNTQGEADPLAYFGFVKYV